MNRHATVPGGSAAHNYEFNFWNLVIRPPRTIYHPVQLGPVEFIADGVRGVRRDLKLKTKRGGYLACSHFLPRQDWQNETLRKCPVVVYLHGNSSSRLEAMSYVGSLIKKNISLFCFDAAGCGLSDGEYVSLGWHEKDDLATVVAHIRQSPFCGPVGLWGRSMGAVTALLYADQDPTLGAICLDSPFASFRQLAEDLAQSDNMIIPLPSFVVSMALRVIRRKVQELADFDIDDLVPLDHASRSFVPAIFMHGEQDSFISPSHSRQLYDAYLGDKQYVSVKGDHNSERNREVVGNTVDFFVRAFRLGELDLDVGPSRRRGPSLGPFDKASRIISTQTTQLVDNPEDNAPSSSPPSPPPQYELPDADSTRSGSSSVTDPPNSLWKQVLEREISMECQEPYLQSECFQTNTERQLEKAKHVDAKSFEGENDFKWNRKTSWMRGLPSRSRPGRGGA